MTLHTVAPGQTLFSIGRQYGLDPGLIARINGLAPPYELAVGQSLLILFPATLHTVQPGESLASIAATSGVSILQILRCNPNLGGLPAVYPGQVLVLAWEDVPSRSVEVNGYAYPYVDEAVLRGILPYATYLTPFTYGVSASGGLVSLTDQRLIALAKQYGVTSLLHLSTLTEADTFSSERAAYVLGDPARQAALAELVVRQIEARGYGGADLDFEYLPAALAEAYAAFAGKLRKALNARGMELFVALAPKTSASQPGLLYEGHNYHLLGENSDAVLLMTYEWGHTYGPPMAVAPIQAVRRVLDYALTELPPEKIFLGFPNYAYDWTLPFVAGESRAQSLSNPGAVALAIRYRAEIQFDEAAQTPWFRYTDSTGRIHEVWFEDPRSSLAKFRLVEEHGLRGLGYWNFMRPFPANFSLLNAMFQIKTPEG